jgi:uncharacterized repeat protein (TIGR03803 family)
MIAKLPFVRHAILLAGIFSAAGSATSFASTLTLNGSNAITFAPFTLVPVATPVFSPAAGVYSHSQSVTITSATSGASIVYTTDGSIPTVSGGTITHGALYSGPITVGDTTLSAIAFANGYSNSAVAIGGYSLQTAVILPATTQAAAPTFSLAPGTYSSVQSTTISSTTSGATIIYTTDGSTPTENNGTPTGTGTTLSNGASVSVSSTMILKAIAHATGDTDSTVASAIYTITSWPRAIVNVIHDFDGGSPSPIGGLIQASDGNFYGTAAGSNSSNSAVFKLTSANAYTPFNLVPPNGFEPTAALVQGTDGNFYGTTFSGGGSSDGTIFKMTSISSVTPLVFFSGANGSNPASALVQGTDGNFYGTTSLGGGSQVGTVFRVTPTGTLASLVSFNRTNGAAPVGSLLQYTDGNFYGTTSLGGSSASGSNPGDGTIFKMTPAGFLTTLVSFNGLNGANPLAGLIKGSDGFFYGTTGEDGSINDGTVFTMTPGGSLTTLATFTGGNGDQPSASLVQGTDGNFYGVTEQGGSGFGTIFRTPASGGLTTLASFDNANGNDPSGSLIQALDGNFYGTASGGGVSNDGVIFQLIVPANVTAATAPSFSLAAGTYTGTQTMTITTTTSGASIVYTTNGTLPSERGGLITNGTLYSGSVSISATATLEALAFKSGMFDSAVTSSTYTISSTPASTTPAASGGGGGGGAPSYLFLGFLAFAGVLRWKLRKAQELI